MQLIDDHHLYELIHGWLGQRALVEGRASTLVDGNSAQNHSQLAISRVGELRTAINVEVDNVSAVRCGKIDPDRQPLANLLDACACVAIRCQNFPIGKIESNTRFIWPVRLVDLVASPNAKICSGLRSYPRRYSVPLILDEAGHLSGNRMQAILNGDQPQYGVAIDCCHTWNNLRIYPGYSKPENLVSGSAGRAAS